MIQVNLNYKRLSGFPWFAQMIRKLEYHLGRGPVIFIACLGGGGRRRILRGMIWGNGGGISCRQQSLKRRTFENLTAFEWSGWGGGGRRIGQPYEVIRKNFIVTQIKCSDSTPPSHNKLYDFLLSVLCDKTYYKWCLCSGTSISRSAKGLISRVRYITIGPQALIMYVVNLEINNSPKWVLFNIVIGQITSDALWK